MKFEKFLFFFFPPRWSQLLCSARGRAKGTTTATPEVQANVLHLCILNRRQGKVPLGCPGNHASQHALCEGQEEGVTRRALCEWTSCELDRHSSLFISSTCPFLSTEDVIIIIIYYYYYYTPCLMLTRLSSWLVAAKQKCSKTR